MKFLNTFISSVAMSIAFASSVVQAAKLSKPVLLGEPSRDLAIPEIGISIETISGNDTTFVGKKGNPVWTYKCDGICSLASGNSKGLFILAGFRDGSYYNVTLINPKNGKILWSKKLKKHIKFESFYAGKYLTSEDDTFGFQSGSSYSFLDLKGEVVEEHKLKGKLSGKPIVHDELVFWRFLDNTLIVSDLKGEEKWRWQIESGEGHEFNSNIENILFPTKSTVLINFELLNNESEKFDLGVRVFNIENGELTFKFHPANSVVLDKDLVIMQHALENHVVAYNKKTFEQEWKSKNPNAGRGFNNLVLVGDKYLLSADKQINLFNIKSGKILDSNEPLDQVECGVSNGSGGKIYSWFWEIYNGNETNSVMGRYTVTGANESSAVCNSVIMYKIVP